MANSLTGDFDAVLQIAAPAMNAMMAVMHQRQTGPIRLLHTATVRLEDPDSRVAGVAAVQYSAPAVSVPATGARTRVTVHQHLRVRYTADAGSTALPEYLHGEAAIAVAFGHVADRRLGGSLEVRFSAAAFEDIQFRPASGASTLTADEQRQVVAAIRAYVRRALEPVHERLDLDAAVRQVDFRTLPHASFPTLMALVSFERSDIAERAADAVTRVLLDHHHGFAVAIGADYARARLASVLEGHTQFRTRVGPFTEDVTLEDVRLDFVPHAPGTERLGFPATGYALLTIRGRGDADAGGIGDFTFTAHQVLAPVIRSGGIALTAPMDPTLTVDGLAGILLDLSGDRPTVLAELRRQRDAVLERANRELATLFVGAGPAALLDRLGVPATVTLTSVEVQADGVIVRGRVVTEPAPAAIAAFRVRQRPAGLEVDAVESWVPGGRIEQYRWRSGGGPVRVESHRFTHQPVVDPEVMFQQVCLEVFGSQTIASGATRSVYASRCGFFMAGLGVGTALAQGLASRLSSSPPGLLVQVPPYATSVSAAGIAGHVDLLRSAPAAAFNDTNVLIYFASADRDEETKAMETWLGQRPAETPSLVVITVAADGSSARPAPASKSDKVAWVSAFDHEGAWTKTFDVSERPALALIARDGEVVWRHQGALTAEKLASNIDPLLRGSYFMDWRELRLGVDAGEVAPDFLFEYAKDHQMAVRKLKGRAFTICFWAPWSEPSIAELRRISKAAEGNTPAGAPLVLAVCDGASADGAAGVLEKERLDAIAVPDPQGAIARIYGVSCWPTLVEVDAEGYIVRVQLGRDTHDVPESQTAE